MFPGVWETQRTKTLGKKKQFLDVQRYHSHPPLFLLVSVKKEVSINPIKES